MLKSTFANANFSVLVVLVGDDRQGVSAVVNRLNEWMDARFVQNSCLRRAH